MSLASQHVVITGATRGLGRALARAFQAAGARVSLLARSEPELRALHGELGARCAVYAGDIRDEGAVKAALAHFRAAHGPVEVLVNNAGIGAYKPFLERTLDELHAEVDVNFRALVTVTHACAAEMAARGSGTIVNIASDLARRPLASMAVYAATKHAVVGLSQSLSRELKSHGIRVICVNPGIIDTCFGGRAEGDLPGTGALRPEHVAALVLNAVAQPPEVLVDEITIHPIGQDF